MISTNNHAYENMTGRVLSRRNQSAETAADPIHDLANAIIQQAVLDYRHALISCDMCAIRTLERFFAGHWCEILTGLDMPVIAVKVKRMVLKYGE